MSLNREALERESELARLAAGPATMPAAEESTLALQIRAAVTARVEPFEVEIVEIERGARLMVGVVGIKQVFGYRRFMADGERNQHTPESFADAVVEQVQQHVGRAMAAQAKRDRKAARRIGRAG